MSFIIIKNGKIVSGQLNQQQSDWEQSNPSNVSFIKNKPSIPSLISDLNNDVGFITISDIPLFNPSNYDLNEFNNNGLDPFARISDISAGNTNLSYEASPTQGTVTSDTGNDATIPLADNTNAGLFSPTEKNKLAGIADGAEVNVNADWNATSGDAQILNKPTIPDVSGFVPYTGATQDVELGENKYISDKGFEIPTSDKGVFKVNSEGSYNTLDFISDGTEGTPTVALKINSEDGVQTYVNTEDNTYGSSLIQQPTALSVNAYSPTDLNDFLIEADKTTTNKPISLPKTVFNSDIETAGEKELVWNDQDGTLDIGLKGGNVTLQVGQEQVARVVNKTSPLINLLEADYQVVKVVGATGQRLSVALAQADSSLNSAVTLGVVTETINANQEGFVTTGGQVREINTTGSLQGETWNDGDVLYLSPTTAGALTKVRPSAPDKAVVVGFVEYAHANHGKIYVKIDAGITVDELDNVTAPTPNNNDVLSYNSSTGIWENKTVVNALGYTPANEAVVTDISLTSTINGWSVFTRREIRVIDYGHCAVIIFALEGVSNSASSNFTLPFANAGGLTSNYIRTVNNSVNQTNPGNATIVAGSSVVVLNVNNTGGVFTASGNKSTIGQILIRK